MTVSSHRLYLPGSSPAHRIPAEVKIVCALLAVFAVVATPRELFWPIGLYALGLLGLWRWAGIPLRWIGPRLLIELPFVVLAVLLPFAAGEPRTTVLGVSLSVTGLFAAWGIVAKGTIGVGVSLTLAATTSVRELPGGLTRLRVPGLIVTIVVLMLRYVDVLLEEAARMRLARISRGDDPRTLRQAGATARGAGMLFLRSYERGERVHLAMLSRGFDGTVPAFGTRPATRAQWIAGCLPAIAAMCVCLSAWALR
ncbi:cobalt/nickel transport system permease protein [Nocardia tenerifensis]|uniref:Cobalt/nickel transport system permease protein n=1 Tax=Nocardia tenerifensis TaxID=228006 RepID=A0A318KB90_9NOCA|nr:cobalt ECF transporter T component CbiQ [Nocardia tenerifensis]PXX54597.1 cobalt/nickel transport system permease protein [Nocardia tenerifensis]